jgi:hypothetical protein
VATDEKYEREFERWNRVIGHKAGRRAAIARSQWWLVLTRERSVCGSCKRMIPINRIANYRMADQALLCADCSATYQIPSQGPSKKLTGFLKAHDIVLCERCQMQPVGALVLTNGADEVNVVSPICGSCIDGWREGNETDWPPLSAADFLQPWFEQIDNQYPDYSLKES